MTDYLLSDTNDLQIVDGNFLTGDSTLQNQKLLLMCEKGAFKQYPTVCVGLATYLLDEDNTPDMLREVRLQFSGDGMKVNALEYLNGKLHINAVYAG